MYEYIFLSPHHEKCFSSLSSYSYSLTHSYIAVANWEKDEEVEESTTAEAVKECDIMSH